ILGQIAMRDRSRIVLDVGKTLSKLTLWDPKGQLLERRSRANERIDAGPYLSLAAAGIESWLAGALRDFARPAQVAARSPVGHCGGAALSRGGAFGQPPLDYEHAMPESFHEDY